MLENYWRPPGPAFLLMNESLHRQPSKYVWVIKETRSCQTAKRRLVAAAAQFDLTENEVIQLVLQVQYGHFNVTQNRIMEKPERSNVLERPDVSRLFYEDLMIYWLSFFVYVQRWQKCTCPWCFVIQHGPGH